ncbi:MAG: peptidase M61 [Sphingobacteriales bacterium JAD_PAG50586_3]|nr:MAG: peptidase M61 [Sphingobacteriales bacterium JAD_PAG50586_3]
MLKKLLPLFALIFSLPLLAQVEYEEDNGAEDKKAYRCFVDLTKVHDDKLTVLVYTPKTENTTVEYRIPRMVPGTYSVYDFGRFVSNFTAFDSRGKKLTVTPTDKDGWLIADAKNLTMVSYDVEDTWDSEDKENFVFEPAGTNIQADTNFVLNNFGFFGYLKDLKEIPYELYITKPTGFYASTGAANLTSGKTADIIKFDNYHQLADSPIMYCQPDTAWLNVGGAKILVSVYSPNKKVTSKELATNINQILVAQKDYLGGTLPVKKYAFIINLYSGLFSRSGSYGALEHSYSSFYFLPEANVDNLSQSVKDISAHEFFHIVTPLNIHSEEIQFFDYDNPKMSAHLWMYEGTTEYAASLVQIKAGLITLDDYITVLQDKIGGAKKYNDTLPFTTMSLGVLDKYEDQYGNVYEKGALISLCLDIKLRSLSDGKYGIQNLMADLSKKYGKDKPFKDNELFDEITRLTYPEIGVFLKTYVGGNKPLPIKDMVELVGIAYDNQSADKRLVIGGRQAFAGSNAIFIDDRLVDDSGAVKGCMLEADDVIVAIDGKRITPDNVDALFTTLKDKAVQGQQVTMVARHNYNNEEFTLTCTPKLIHIASGSLTLKLNPNATPKQLSLRKAWIGQ